MHQTLNVAVATDFDALRQELEASAIPPAQIDWLLQTGHYRPVTAADAHSLTGHRIPGWVVAFPTIDGQSLLTINGAGSPPFYRLKPSWPDGTTGKPKYLTAKGAGCRPYFSPFLSAKARNPEGGSIIDITEGEKKADAACIAGFDTISISGVDAWRDKRSGSSEILPELAALNWKGGRVKLAFDSDIANKASVRSALRELAFTLTKLGAIPAITQIPCEIPDGPGNPTPEKWKNGIDDFLARHDIETYRILRNISRQCVKIVDGELEWCWSHVPKRTDHKALLAWSVFKDRYTVDVSRGILRWNGVIWESLGGKVEERLRTELVWWLDAMGWDQLTDGLVKALIDRLRRVDSVAIPWDSPQFSAFTNGTLNEATGDFRPTYDKKHHLTFCYPFDWDPTATCPLWLKFLQEATAQDDGMIQLIRALIRWTLRPKNRAEKFKIEKCVDVAGGKGTGKSTLGEMVYALAGAEHGAGLITAKVFSDAGATARYQLLGKILGIEFDSTGHVESNGTFNSIVSNEKVLVKKLYVNESGERLGVVLWRIYNDAPTISNAGAVGVDRRVITLPFNVTPEQPDIHLLEKLKTELAGIYQWARTLGDQEMYRLIQCAEDVEAVRRANEEAALDRKPYLEWLMETYPDGHPRASMAELFTSWSWWAERNGHKSGSSKWLGRNLQRVPGVEFLGRRRITEADAGAMLRANGRNLCVGSRERFYSLPIWPDDDGPAATKDGPDDGGQQAEIMARLPENEVFIPPLQPDHFMGQNPLLSHEGAPRTHEAPSHENPRPVNGPSSGGVMGQPESTAAQPFSASVPTVPSFSTRNSIGQKTGVEAAVERVPPDSLGEFVEPPFHGPNGTAATPPAPAAASAPITKDSASAPLRTNMELVEDALAALRMAPSFPSAAADVTAWLQRHGQAPSKDAVRRSIRTLIEAERKDDLLS